MAMREEVSGAGSMSKRTDLNVSKQPTRYISGMSYGEGQATYEQQRAAPMAANPLAQVLSEITPLTAPTQRPDEPITAGMDFGAGPGSEMLPIPPQRPTVSLADTFRQLAINDPSGDAELVYRRLVDEGY